MSKIKEIRYSEYSHKHLLTLKECLENKILTEVYQKSDKIRFLHIFDNLRNYLLDLKTEKEFNEFNQKERVEICRIENGLGGFYDENKNKIVLLLDGPTLDLITISNAEDLHKIVEYVWTAFVHEDTHFQQQNLVNKNMAEKNLEPLKISKGYIKYNPDLPYDLDIKRNVSYFSNQYEVDALAREVGEKIKIVYDLDSIKDEAVLHKTILSIFDDIKKGGLPKSESLDVDGIQKVVNIYWDPRISKKAKMKFFSTLYEYLYNLEALG